MSASSRARICGRGRLARRYLVCFEGCAARLVVSWGSFWGDVRAGWWLVVGGWWWLGGGTHL
jgi:hypothetical protein